MSDYDSYTQEDWDKLFGLDWCCLLRDQPKFANKCSWNKLDGWDWSRLLSEQPEFSEYCSWNKLNGSDWNWLLRYRHQFQDKYEEYMVLGNLKL